MSVQKEGKEKAELRPQKVFFYIEIGLIVSEKGLISIYQMFMIRFIFDYTILSISV